MKRWLLLLILPLAFGFVRLRFDTDPLNLLPSHLPVVRGLKLFQEHFIVDDDLVVTLQAGSADDAESAARSLAERLRSLTNSVAEAAWQSPWREHPEQAAELAAAVWLNQPPEAFASFAGRLSGSNAVATLAESRERLAVSFSPSEVAQLSFDPYGFTRLPLPEASAAGFGPGGDFFVSADGLFRLVTVKARSPLTDYVACSAWLAAIRAEIAEWRRHEGGEMKLGFTGRAVFVTEVSSGMEHDMKASVLLTAVIIAALFWMAHRRLRPMLWLMVLLALILASALALGGLLFGSINVVSLGFAAILLGLAVDYGVVHYQEAMASPGATVKEIRRAIGPSIFWAAVTTISAFLALNFGGLPGLGQLGSLVAIGVALSALVMLFLFLPPLFSDRQKRRDEQIAAGLWPAPSTVESKAGAPSVLTQKRRNLVFAVTAVLLGASAVVLSFGPPGLDSSPDPLRPRHSLAYATLDEIKRRIGPSNETAWIVASGRDEGEVARQLEKAEVVLSRASSNGAIGGYLLPTALWPHPEHQKQNREIAQTLLMERERLAAAALKAGFNTNAARLSEGVMEAWSAALTRTNLYWPTNDMSRWVLNRMAARATNGWLAAGYVFMNGGSPMNARSVAGWAGELEGDGLVVSGWELLGDSLLRAVRGRLWLIVGPMLTLILLALGLAFRRPREMLLSLAVLAASGVCLLAVMRLAGWSWNLLNLMALPLMLGAGVDYSIFMQFGLRRHQGDLAAAHLAVGRALVLCGGTAVAGFGSLALSSNGGIASLGQICAAGLGLNMLISVFLLPVWWRASQTSISDFKPQPSALYGARIWRFGVFVARFLPRGLVELLCRAAARAYWLARPRRRRIVIENLLPLLHGDRLAATRSGRRLVWNFARKISDLWRFEGGGRVMESFTKLAGWERFEAAHARGRGVLIVTIHLGNWELGGPIFTSKGHRLLALSTAEPDAHLTALREAARKRWGVETLIVGGDPFAFVEVIQRLDAGGTVALLLDRPAAKTAVHVELLGRPFPASIAAAELARASGCAVLPVVVVHGNGGYEADILSEVAYDRAALRGREERRIFTEEIVRAFEPWLRHYPDQWYHFVPVWPPA